MADTICLGDDSDGFQVSRRADFEPHISLQTFSLEFDASFIRPPLCQMVPWL